MMVMIVDDNDDDDGGGGGDGGCSFYKLEHGIALASGFCICL